MTKRREVHIREVPKLAGERITLRGLRPMDGAAIYRWLSDRQVAGRLPRLPKPYRVSDAHEWVKVTRQMAEAETDYHFGIEHIASGEVIGMIGLNRINTVDREAEVGYWLARPYWRQGLTEEALRLVLIFAFGTIRLHRVFAIVLATNVASAALLEKTGFRREAVLREQRRTGRTYTDVYVYGLLAKEYGQSGRGSSVKGSSR